MSLFLSSGDNNVWCKLIKSSGCRHWKTWSSGKGARFLGDTRTVLQHLKRKTNQNPQVVIMHIVLFVKLLTVLTFVTTQLVRKLTVCVWVRGAGVGTVQILWRCCLCKAMSQVYKIQFLLKAYLKTSLRYYTSHFTLKCLCATPEYMSTNSEMWFSKEQISAKVLLEG